MRVPAPSSLSTQMYPPLCLTMPYTIESPSPVPCPGGLVVKNGSNARAFVSAFIPVPVSVTASRTYGPATTRNGSPSTERVKSTLAVSMVSNPPSRMASRAFTARFISTCSSCAASALTGQRSSARYVRNSMSSPIRRVSSCST